MGEFLSRCELPLQAVEEYGDNCQAIVPVHLKILSLPAEVRQDVSFLRKAAEVVRRWYNQDINYHLDVLHATGYDVPNWMDKFGEFQDNWALGAIPEETGFLELQISTGKRRDFIKLCDIPVIFHNQRDEYGEWCCPRYVRDRKWVEVDYRRVGQPDGVNMHPNKMKKYGVETKISKIDEEKGIAEVMGHEFCSDYYDNTAIGFLLRDFGVFYLNHLLRIVTVSPNEISYS